MTSHRNHSCVCQVSGDPSDVDEWFEAKTRGLNDFQKSELKKKWGTMQAVLSSRSRMEKIVQDIEDYIRQNFRNEVPSSVIGQRVVEALRNLDEIAYVRFASVYRKFQDN